MRVEADRECFICGPENPIGVKAVFDLDEQMRAAVTTVTLSGRYQGWHGVVHGGIISALLDEAAIYSCRPESLHAVTAGLNVRFLRPVPVETEVQIRAEMKSRKRKVALVHSRLYCQDELMAEAEVKVMLLQQQGEVQP